MILDIEQAWHKAPGWFGEQSPEQQARMIAQHTTNRAK